MGYRDDLPVLERRIEELEQRLAERKKERDRLDSESNLGPEAPKLFSRIMYWLGRGIGRAIPRRRLRSHARATEAARERVRLLEGLLARLEEEIVTAQKRADQALLDKISKEPREDDG